MSGINNGPGDIELKVILFFEYSFFFEKDFNVAFGIHTFQQTDLSSLVTSDPHTK